MSQPLTAATHGVFTIAATPFRPDGARDLESLDRLCDFFREKGANGLTLLGIMGEAPKLTLEESVQVARRVLARLAGQVPVIVGVSAPGFAPMKDLADRVMDLGAAGVMIAPAASLRGDDQALTWYQAVADYLGPVPFVLQDFPVITGVHLSPDGIRRIAGACPTFAVLKHEDWPGLEKISALRAQEAAGARRLPILCGNGGQFLVEEMRRGADGAMTGFAWPEMMADVVRLAAAGEWSRAHDLFDAYLPLLRLEVQPGGHGLAVRKYLLASRGAMAHATARAPAVTLSARAVEEIDRLVARQQARLAELA
ncbi:MAG: dihydrodipicolinate synthase family protein [Alphaproteobacteria bacterium]